MNKKEQYAMSGQTIEERLSALEVSAVSSLPVNPDKLYKANEVASFLSCSTQNVYDLMTRREIATTRVGANNKGLRVRGAALIAFLDERTDGGPRPTGKFKHLAKYLGQ